MKLARGVRLLRLLNTRPESALTTRELEHQWRHLGGTPVALRSIQRYMSEISEDGPDGAALVGVVRRGIERAYYLRTSQVANWFMTEEAALDLQISREIYGRAFRSHGRSDGDKLADLAERLVEASPATRRVRDRLRIVPDGIGRLPARIEPGVLRASTEAIGKDRKLRLTYTSAAGKATSQVVTPLGLVAKDGTIYLVAVKGLSDAPRNLPLQRVSEAEVHSRPAQSRPEFDLQQYILQSHQLSHLLGEQATPVALKLRVAPETIYHFRERPLSSDQKVTAPTDTEPWYIVRAAVPLTVLLRPFLVGMGPGVEVLSPAVVRDEIAAWIREMWAHYADDSQGQ